MALIIEDEEVNQAIVRLAKLRKVSLTQAVGDAVRNELNREQKRRANLAEELLKIGRRCAEGMPADVKSSDHGDMLYDEMGLPR